MKFSIIMPIYNISQYILKAISSVETQKYENYELIIIDDGSTDDSMSVVKKFCNRNKKITYMRIEHKGVGFARSFGIYKATGDYILFLDGDDYLSSGLLEYLNKKILEENMPDVVRYNAKKVSDKKLNIDNEMFSVDYSNNINGRACLDIFIDLYNSKEKIFSPVWLYCINKNFYNKNKFEFDENHIQEDFGLMPLVIFKADKISFINYCGYNYYQREKSIMNDRLLDKRKAYDMLFFSNELYVYFEKLKNEYDFDYLKIYKYLYKCAFQKGKYLKGIEKKVFEDTLYNTNLGLIYRGK